ncbi:MAG TPA: hypothetical protein VNV86_14265 [Candidatus Acidoferrum sp.]|nr:hypothetical protein [Candidatus Acidoferrum sp.]
MLAGVAFAQDPFAGVFEGQSVVVELKGARGSYVGTLSVQGQSYPAIVTAKGANGDGDFTVNGQEYRFSLTPSADGFI